MFMKNSWCMLVFVPVWGGVAGHALTPPLIGTSGFTPADPPSGAWTQCGRSVLLLLRLIDIAGDSFRDGIAIFQCTITVFACTRVIHGFQLNLCGFFYSFFFSSLSVSHTFTHQLNLCGGFYSFFLSSLSFSRTFIHHLAHLF